jgi:hypothetical protein
MGRLPWQSFILESRASIGLRYFGAALALTNVITAFYWLTSPTLFKGVNLAAATTVCWPFFQNCDISRNFVFENATAFNLSLGFLGLASILAFFREYLRAGYWFLAVATVLKFFLLFQDYRLMGNYHYMSLTTILLFLLLPDRVATVRMLLPLFYFSAGMLKLNPEWLSGAALLKDLPGPKFLEYPALVYVVLLELAIVPAVVLFSYKSKPWWFVVINLFLFHVISYSVVGYLYPSIMFCLLSFYFLCPTEKEIRLPLISSFALIIFLLLQLNRTFLFPDSNIAGQGRTLALNMLDATPECHSHFIIKTGVLKVILPLELDLTAPRVRCDPIVIHARMRELCRFYPKISGFDLDVIVETRILTENHFRRVLDLRDVCASPTSVSWLGEVQQ